MNYLHLKEIVEIASRVLDLEVETLIPSSRLDLADSAAHSPQASFGGVEFYEGLVTKVGLLGYRLIRNHPFPDGNKRVAFLAMIEMAERNGAFWDEPYNDPEGDDTVAFMFGAASGEVDEAAFLAWVATRVVQPGH